MGEIIEMPYHMTSATGAEVAHKDMANAIRALAMDAVEAAKSGHPGMPMGMADVATVLFRQFLKFDPAEPEWPDRDRFVLSAGHGSMLQYALLYLTGYEGVTLDELKRFRQLGAKTAGHPEYGHCPGIETTTGPLGQGLGNAVGMAIAERMLNARYGDGVADHHTYAIVGDGCLMEGISHESIDLAGHLRLSKMIVLWDDNAISIDGPTSLATSTNQLQRFRAAGWDVEQVDGHDREEIAAAIGRARDSDRPSFIACKTIIGYGAPNKQGTEGVHGAPLGAAEIEAARAALGWPHPPFQIPGPILTAWRRTAIRGAEARKVWNVIREAQPADLRKRFAEDLDGVASVAVIGRLDALMAQWLAERPKLATRQASQKVLEAIAPAMPNLVGGSADLTHSNLTHAKPQRPVTPTDFSGSYIHYGVREHGMAAAMNGIALHGGLIPYGGTFLVFTDYCRASIRLSALMQQRVIYVMTHDSIGLGEDGPTHQPVEHVAGLRAMPNVLVFRPADAIETAECWEIALGQRTRPSILCLTRQALPALRLTPSDGNLVNRGAYVLREAEGPLHVSLLATGSEVSLALEAADALAADGINAAVVSMPCWELFAEQPRAYQDAVIGPAPCVGIEAGVRQGWDQWLGRHGPFIGMTGFGASAPAADLYRHFGITAERIAAAARSLID
ncbi:MULTISPECIES: transketolase [Rhodomicrobium]|uniref:transketolase n=1 Tax=Rhodomicrobium TaxID=1068 RepID=UPI001FD88ED9|nr:MULTISPECIES: transketolase [Rhodomicrobium]